MIEKISNGNWLGLVYIPVYINDIFTGI